MKDHIKQQVLAYLESHSKPVSTSELVMHVFSSEYTYGSKTQKAKLHRRLLHHLNALIAAQQIMVSHIKGKGEKYYELLALKRPQKGAVTPIDASERQEITYKYSRDTWLTQINAFLLNVGVLDSLKELDEYIQKIAPYCNDVIALNDFESAIQTFALADVQKSMTAAKSIAEQAGIDITLIIDATNITDEQAVFDFLQYYAKDSHSPLVFDVTSRELMHHKEFFEQVALLFSRNGLKLNFKNDDLHKAPLFVGKAGPYAITPAVWDRFVKKETLKAIVVTQTTTIIDIEKFFQTGKAQEFMELTKSVAHSLFLANIDQYNHFQQYFHGLREFLGSDFLFDYSQLQVRFLNHAHIPQHHTFDTLHNLLDEAITQIKNYAHNQTVIYSSIGIPLHFRISVSQAYRQFNNNPSLFASYNYLSIKQSNQLYEKAIRKQLSQKERYAQLCEGCFEVRIEREGKVLAHQALSECAMILNSYQFPFFCYRFERLDEQDVSLARYLQ